MEAAAVNVGAGSGYRGMEVDEKGTIPLVDAPKGGVHPLHGHHLTGEGKHLTRPLAEGALHLGGIGAVGGGGELQPVYRADGPADIDVLLALFQHNGFNGGFNILFFSDDQFVKLSHHFPSLFTLHISGPGWPQ